MADTADSTASVTHCPMCNEAKALVKHCKDTDCGWVKCTNTKCDLTIDIARKVAHCLSPTGEKRKNGALKRQNLVLDGGVWRERLL